MNPSPLHSALRETRELATNHRVWALLSVLGLTVGLAGPFSTFEYLPVLPRLAYWIGIVLVTAYMGTFVTSLIETWLKPRLPVWLALGIACLVAGPSIAGVVALINVGTFGPNVHLIDLATLAVYCTLITGAIAVMGVTWSGASSPGPTHETMRNATPALMDRLPRPQRGRLLHLAVSDHYVDVTTDKGTSLVLMRLSDAIKETAPIAGLQVHRSHWVALDAVRHGARQGGKPVLELENGTQVPVSRTYLDAVRQAGLLG